MGDGRKLVVGGQSFDLRLDLFLCPTHGLLVPMRFDDEWTTDEGCPVLMADEESCGLRLEPVFLDGLVSKREVSDHARILAERDEEIGRLKEEAQARAWNAKEFTCEKCHTVVPWHEAKPGLYSPLCPYCDDGSSCLRSAEAIQRARADAAQQALTTLRSKVREAAKQLDMAVTGVPLGRKLGRREDRALARQLGRDLADVHSRLQRLLDEATPDHGAQGADR